MSALRVSAKGIKFIVKKKRVSISVFQIFITLLIIIAIVVIIIVARKNVKVKLNKIAIGEESIDFSGSGTNDDPYKIENIEDLVKFSENVNNGKSYNNQYFELTNELDFQNDESYANSNGKYGDINNDGKSEDIKTELTKGNGFKAIGNLEEHPFEGIFNGNSKTIKNLTINANDASQNTLVGLFGNNKGSISNVKVVGNITVNDILENKKIYIGMICAKNGGSIQACNTEGEITAVSNGANTVIETAGITAENMGKITDSASSVNITSNQLKAGITAKNMVTESIENSGEIVNCTNTGNIKENVGSDYYTAGIVADNQKGNITSCNNNGTIVGRKVGGVAGTSTGYIVACQNIGTISNVKENSNDSEFAGGIVGIIDTAIVENCKNTGDVLGLTNIGGIAGENKGTISKCKNEGTVSKISEYIGKTVNLGGIVGKNSQTSKLTNSKNYGKISSKTDDQVSLGGICGVLYSTSLIENCENNGGLEGAAKVITPNEDLDTNVSSCVSNNGGSADTAEFGELNIGVIYGKFQ